MSDRTNLPADVERRWLLQRGFALAASAAIAVPAAARSPQAQRMRLRMEGDTGLDWVLSLYAPPILADGLPPGTAARVRLQYPAPDRDPPHSRPILAISAFLAPAGVPPGVPAPELAVISTMDVAVEDVIVASAAFADEATRPRNNVAIVGRIVANDVESPFGSLLHRVATTTFGFDWTAAGDAAAFRLVAVNAAGSHITVVPLAAGEIAFG